jgi:hypothetical protein
MLDKEKGKKENEKGGKFGWYFVVVCDWERLGVGCGDWERLGVGCGV